MVSLKRTELRTLDKLFDMKGGYVLDFSNSTMADWFADEFSIDIYSEKYAFNGTSKARHLRAFLEVEPAHIVVPVLNALLDYKHTSLDYRMEEQERTASNYALNRVLERINKSETIPAIQLLDNVSTKYDLDTVRLDLERALNSAQKDPEDSMTAACAMVESLCRSILLELNLPLPTKKDVKSLYNAVREPLGLSPKSEDLNSEIADDVRKILSGLATVIEGIGALRTHGGDAHGRERGRSRVDHRISSLAIHSATTVSLFLVETWQKKYPEKELNRH